MATITRPEPKTINDDMIYDWIWHTLDFLTDTDSEYCPEEFEKHRRSMNEEFAKWAQTILKNEPIIDDIKAVTFKSCNNDSVEITWHKSGVIKVKRYTRGWIRHSNLGTYIGKPFKSDSVEEKPDLEKMASEIEQQRFENNVYAAINFFNTAFRTYVVDSLGFERKHKLRKPKPLIKRVKDMITRIEGVSNYYTRFEEMKQAARDILYMPQEFKTYIDDTAYLVEKTYGPDRNAYVDVRFSRNVPSTIPEILDRLKSNGLIRTSPHTSYSQRECPFIPGMYSFNESCFTPRGLKDKKFKKLVEKYGIVQYGDLFFKDLHMDLVKLFPDTFELQVQKEWWLTRTFMNPKLYQLNKDCEALWESFSELRAENFGKYYNANEGRYHYKINVSMGDTIGKIKELAPLCDNPNYRKMLHELPNHSTEIDTLEFWSDRITELGSNEKHNVKEPSPEERYIEEQVEIRQNNSSSYDICVDQEQLRIFWIQLIGYLLEDYLATGEFNDELYKANINDFVDELFPDQEYFDKVANGQYIPKFHIQYWIASPESKLFKNRVAELKAKMELIISNLGALSESYLLSDDINFIRWCIKEQFVTKKDGEARIKELTELQEQTA